MGSTARNEQVLLELWKCGKWQFIVFNILTFCFTYQVFLPIMNHTFIGMSPESYHCRLPNNTVVSNNSVPFEDGKPSSCKMYVHESDGTTRKSPCIDGFQYKFHDNVMKTSYVTSYDLTCKNDYLVEASLTVFMAGTLVGGAIVPNLADRWGRKLICTTCCMLIVAIGALMSVMPDYYSFTSLRFLYGALRESVSLTGIVWCLELLPEPYRNYGGMGFQLYWPMHWCVFVVQVYFIRDWRWLQLISSLCGLTCIAIIVFVPESLMWLLTNNKMKEFKELVKTRADKWNKKKFDTTKLHSFEVNEINNLLTTDERADVAAPTDALKKKYTVLDIFRNKRSRWWTVQTLFLWFQNVAVYYGLSYMSTITTPNAHVSFLISGLVEIPAYAVGMFAVERMGRRGPIIVHELIAGACLLLLAILPNNTPAMLTVGVILTTVGKYCITLTFAVVLVYCPELYPTNVRSAGQGLNGAFSRVAQLVVPLLLYLRRSHPWLPLLIFGVMSLLACVATYMLPETRWSPMPDTFEDLESLSSPFFPARRSTPVIIDGED